MEDHWRRQWECDFWNWLAAMRPRERVQYVRTCGSWPGQAQILSRINACKNEEKPATTRKSAREDNANG